MKLLTKQANKGDLIEYIKLTLIDVAAPLQKLQT